MANSLTGFILGAAVGGNGGGSTSAVTKQLIWPDGRSFEMTPELKAQYIEVLNNYIKDINLDDEYNNVPLDGGHYVTWIQNQFYICKALPFALITINTEHSYELDIVYNQQSTFQGQGGWEYGITYTNLDTKTIRFIVRKDIDIVDNKIIDIYPSEQADHEYYYIDTNAVYGLTNISNLLSKTNDAYWEPYDDYNPTSKKYVDDKLKDIQLYKFPNATIIGNPTINHGQISDFSIDDHLEFPFLVDFKSRAFEINFMFTTGDQVTSQENILDSEFGLAFAIRNGHAVLALSFNGTSWATEQTGSLELIPNETYLYRISWNGILYRVQYSLNGGENYYDDITFGSTQFPYPKQMYIGVGKLANNSFSGIVNLNYANVKISDELIWQGMDDVGLATRLATDLSNIDEAGRQKILEIVTEVLDGEY